MTPILLAASLGMAGVLDARPRSLPPAQTPVGQDYNDGYTVGWSYAMSVPTAEWALYGAGGSCLAGAPGCVAVTAGGYYVDPENLPPWGDQFVVPQAFLGTTPVPPPTASDPATWAQGYEDGWDACVQRRRAKWAFAGGAAVPVAAGTAYVGLLGFSLFMAGL